MPLVRKFAVQGHAVPNGYYGNRPIFDPEVLAQNPRGYEYEHSDSLHEAFDDVRLFRCKDCGTVVYEHELDEHFCEEE